MPIQIGADHAEYYYLFWKLPALIPISIRMREFDQLIVPGDMDIAAFSNQFRLN